MENKKLMKPSLSASSQKVAELIHKISGGNQRDFARKVGCSQPLISRIVNGKQTPGRELLERIAEFGGVDRTELLATLDMPTTTINTETKVPIAKCLLDRPPTSRGEELTTDTIAVAPEVFRPSLYAVVAKSCEPAFSDPSELMRADDLLIIESSREQVGKNLLILNGKLCVVKIRRPASNTITLRRVWITFDATSDRWAARTCPDAKVIEFRDNKYGDRPFRSIQLDQPDALPVRDFVDQLVDVNDIVGVAIELIRNL